MQPLYEQIPGVAIAAAPGLCYAQRPALPAYLRRGWCGLVDMACRRAFVEVSSIRHSERLSVCP